jgi:Ca-activated chloride channel family protein
MGIESNYYALLGVSRDATPEEIRDAYFAAARQSHPDVSADIFANERFLDVQKAYEILSDSDKRASYDSRLPAEALVAPQISQKVLYSRSTIPRLGEPQLIYALVELGYIPGAFKQTAPRKNICLVLDRSTSMQGARIDTAKASAVQLLRSLQPDDLVSIVAFSDRAEVLADAVYVSDLERIGARIGQLQTGGGTEIYPALALGIDQIRKHLNPASVNHLILLTDGRTYGDEDACFILAEEAASQGIGISGLGIGHDWNDIFLDRLTGASGGPSVYVSEPKEVLKSLGNVFENLKQIYAEIVSLQFIGDMYCHLFDAYRLQPDPAPIDLDMPLKLGSIHLSAPLKVLLEFHVDDFSEEVEKLLLVDGSLRMKIPSLMIPIQKLSLKLERPVSAKYEPETPAGEMVKAVSQLNLYRLQDKARQAMQTGEIAKATRRLESLATHLLEAGERKLARAVRAEVANIRQSQSLSEEGIKRIKYGTRCLPGIQGRGG